MKSKAIVFTLLFFCGSILSINAQNPTLGCDCNDDTNVVDDNGNITYFGDFANIVSGPDEVWQVTAITGGDVLTLRAHKSR